MLFHDTVEERGDARDDVVGPVHGYGPGQGCRHEPLFLLKVASEESVLGAPEALGPQGPVHAPRSPPGPLQYLDGAAQDGHCGGTSEQGPRRGIAEQRHPGGASATAHCFVLGSLAQSVSR